MGELSSRDEPFGEGAAPVLAVIERRTLLCTLLAQALVVAIPGSEVFLSERIGELESLPRAPALILLGGSDIDPHEAVEQVRQTTGADVPIMLLADEDDVVAPALFAGFRGVLLVGTTPMVVAMAAVQLVLAGGTYSPLLPEAHAPEHLVHAVEVISSQAGRYLGNLSALTPRECQILSEVSQGSSNKELARQLKISENTAKMHMRRILAKLQVRNRTEAAVMFRDQAEMLARRDQGAITRLQ